jgi:hypothetical protein
VTSLRWLTLMALLWAVTLNAHQQKEAITRILFNPRTANIEVMHRFLLHDAEHAVKELLYADADILGSESTRQSFADYVYARFSISDQDGHPIGLTPVGYEIEGRFIWVYEEAPVPDKVTALRITHDALRDLWPEQKNLVNLERDGQLKSAYFSDGSREITIRLQNVSGQ